MPNVWVEACIIIILTMQMLMNELQTLKETHYTTRW